MTLIVQTSARPPITKRLKVLDLDHQGVNIVRQERWSLESPKIGWTELEIAQRVRPEP
jgi:hypothetical protein